jgi:hypothetical protein
MEVEFQGNSGAAAAALKLGRGTDNPRVRSFAVRRLDAFCRWILSFGGEAVPVAPPELIDEYRALVRATRTVYGGHDSPSRFVWTGGDFELKPP